MDALTVLALLAGLVLLVTGAELLVRGASQIAASFGISPLVIGLTVVAFGTSAPELAISVRGALTGSGDIAVGNVVGSNICNVLLILGLAAVIAPIAVQKKLVRLDVPLVIGASVVMLLLGLDGEISRLEGLLMFGSLVVYIVFALRSGRAKKGDAAADAPPESSAIVADATPNTVLSAVIALVGLGMLVGGAELMVEAAVTIARAFGVSDLVIGLTVIAVGTSLPEIAATVVATIKGERDMAVGNVIGSNLFNILGVLGLTAAVAPDGVAVSEGARNFDIPVMIAVAVASLPVFFSGFRIARWEGALFIAFYVAYIAYVVLAATEHDALPMFSDVMLTFVLPLTGLTITALAVNAYRQGRRAAS